MSRPVRRSPTLELAEAIAAASRQGKPAYSLSTPTFADRPVRLPDGVRPATSLSPNHGMTDLRDMARCSLLGKWDLPKHECLIVGGAKSVIFSILRSMLPAGGKVMIVSPHWPSYEDLAGLAHLRPVFHETGLSNGFAIDAGRLRQDLAATGAGAVICSNPCNPTGRVLARNEADALCRAAADAGAILLLDESFSNIVFDGPKWRSSVCPPAPHLFVVSSFSKNYHLQGLRLGACLAHRDHAAAVAAVHQTLLSAAPTPSQNIARQVLQTSGAAADHYGQQRQLVVDFVAAQGWPHLATEGGFYLFPQVPQPAELRRRLEARRLLSLPGETFGAGYRDHLRICFGKPVAEVKKILGILGEVAGALRDRPHGR